jgi:hypothetical protein
VGRVGKKPERETHFSLEEREKGDVIQKSEREKCRISQRSGCAGEGRKARAIASHFGNWLYRLRYSNPTFKTLLCECVYKPLEN